jgi:hypothetical protein
MPLVRLGALGVHVALLLARASACFELLARFGGAFGSTCVGPRSRQTRWPFALGLSLSALVSTPVLARPPHFVPSDTLHPFVIEPVRSSTGQARGIPPSLQAALRRLGGARALRVAQGVPAGKHVSLRPMFWVTRDHTGAMFAVGGLF